MGKLLLGTYTTELLTTATGSVAALKSLSALSATPRLSPAASRRPSIAPLGNTFVPETGVIEISEISSEEEGEETRATATLINSLASYPNAVVRLGNVLVVKETNDDEPSLTVHRLTPEQGQLIAQNPRCLRSPKTIFELLEKHKS